MSLIFKRLSLVLPYVYAAVAIVVTWQLAIILTGAHEAILPSPWLTGKTFAGMVASGEIFEHAGISVMRVFIAWLLAASVAVPLGLRQEHAAEHACRIRQTDGRPRRSG